MSDPIARLNAALEGRYLIERELGEGGMATVYLAEDLKHERKVALKVLKPELAAVVGAERFLAEIKTTANLNHPHILPLHDSGEADSFLFYVMPHVEGESLRQRLDREKQLPVDEAVRIATAVAHALDHAHRHGVIHRDIKPANILLQDGEPVVADFGIALAVNAAGEGRLTETGLSLGTPHYMSPEQAAGDEAYSAASDVYSLGCVLYVMLTGDPPHTGSSAPAILGKIVLGEVTRPTKLRHTIPANVEGAILKALERLPADRFESAVELAAALKDKTFRHGLEPASERGLWNWVTICSTVVAVLALAAAMTGVFVPEPQPPPVTQQVIPFLGDPSDKFWAWRSALAPDGSRIVYQDKDVSGAGEGLWVKERGDKDPWLLSRTLGARPVFSPDGQWIAYFHERSLVKHPIEGGGAQTLLEGGDFAWNPPVAWLENGNLLIGGAGGALVRIAEDGASPPDTVLVWGADAPVWIQGLPGGEAALVVRCMGIRCGEGNSLYAVDLQDGTAQLIREGAKRAWYVPTGHLLWVRVDGSVFATPFDLDRLDRAGPDVSLFDGVHTWPHLASMVVAQDGTVVYVEGQFPERLEAELVWVDREGSVSPIDPDWTFHPGVSNRGLSLSADGTRLALGRTERGLWDIWVKELPRGAGVRLTHGPILEMRPRWLPGGEGITFLSDRNGELQFEVYAQDPSADEEPASILGYRGLYYREAVYTPDMTWLLVRTVGSAGNRDVWAVQEGTDSLIPMLVEDFDEEAISFSPQGRFLLYVSNETGRNEVYVRPFPNVNDRKWAVSTNGGVVPRWSNRGGEIFYVDAENRMIAATVETTPTFEVTRLTPLFEVPEDILFQEGEQYPLYDVAPEDDRFLMLRLKDPVDVPGPRMIQILNFFTELKEKVGR